MARRIIAIIPARAGSKGISDKNIKYLAGHPLLAYSIAAASRAEINPVIVSTDSEKISEVAKDNGSEVIMRPAELAKDDTPTLPVLQHIVANIDEKFDCVVCLQPTSPLRTTKHIDESLELFESDSEADFLVSVVKVPHNMVPMSLMKLSGRYIKSYIDQNQIILKRQDKPELYARNGPAILIMTIKKLLSGELYKGKTIPYLMDSITSIDIDEMNDIITAEVLINNKT